MPSKATKAPTTPKPSFEMPVITGKTISPASILIYKKKLSLLHQTGIKDITDLLSNADEVIEFINTITDNSATTASEKDKEKTEKRHWMSAIDYALFDTPAEDKKAYTEYYSTLWHAEGKTWKDKDGNIQKWMSRDEWFAQNKK